MQALLLEAGESQLEPRSAVRPELCKKENTQNSQKYHFANNTIWRWHLQEKRKQSEVRGIEKKLGD